MSVKILNRLHRHELVALVEDLLKVDKKRGRFQCACDRPSKSEQFKTGEGCLLT